MANTGNKKVQTPLQQLKKLIKDAGLDMADLRNLASKRTMIVSWHIDDVFMAAGEDYIRISEQLAKEILEEMKDNHDATLGITWDTIHTYIDMKNLEAQYFEWNDEKYGYGVIPIKGKEVIVCTDELGELVGDNLEDKELMAIDQQVYFYVPNDVLYGPEDLLIKYVNKNCK